MFWLGIGAVTLGVLMVAQEYSDTIDALVPDVVTGTLGGAFIVLCGTVLVVKSVM
jgi:hypothetical protein